MWAGGKCAESTTACSGGGPASKTACEHQVDTAAACFAAARQLNGLGNATVATKTVSDAAAPADPFPARPPARATGGLEIALLDAPGVTGFELSCRSGHRARARRTSDGAPARFAEVPGEDCRLNFRGSPPAIVHRVTPGTALRCEIKGVTALCESRPLGD